MAQSEAEVRTAWRAPTIGHLRAQLLDLSREQAIDDEELVGILHRRPG